MGRFQMTRNTSRKLKAIAAAALTVTLAVPTTVHFASGTSEKVEAAETVTVPTPIMKVDFDGGFVNEQNTHGLGVVRSDEVLLFQEKLAEDGSYLRDSKTGAVIYDVTDKPALVGVPEEYGYFPVGNQPTTAFDALHNSVLYLNDTVKIPEFKKKDSDSQDEQIPIGSLLQSAYTAESQISLTNPFAGKTLQEANEYGAGVSISYWVKVPNVIDEKTNKVKDSDIIVFNNLNRRVIQKDDDAKRRACIAYDEAVKNNDTEALKDYALGDQKVVTDADGETYTLYENYGKFVRLNPNYPKYVDDKETTKKGGWYAPAKASDGVVTVKDASGKEYKIESLAMGTTEDTNQYDNFRYLYAKDADKSDGYYDKSKVRSEVIEGAMQISAQNDFHFREDDIASIVPEGGTVPVATDGAIITNPNSAESGEQQDFFGSNQLYFDGDETVTDQPNVWHYVTIVIQNDWVVAYVDGQFKDPEVDFSFWQDDAANRADFGARNTGKTFNKGTGLRAPFSLSSSNVAKWPVSGTLQTSPANSYGITMLDWLTDPSTELFIGGTSCAANCCKQDKGTVAGTLVDDVTFYDVPLTEEEAVQSYKNAVAATKKQAAVPAPVAEFNFENGTLNGTNGFNLTAAYPDADKKEPIVSTDAEKGKVLTVAGSTASGESAVVLNKNPFAGKKLTGATVNFWMKMDTPSKSAALSFYGPEVMVQESISGGFVPGELIVDSSTDAYFNGGGHQGVYQDLQNYYKFSILKNDYVNKDEDGILYDADSAAKLADYNKKLATANQWRMITAVFTNSGIQMYLNGEKLSNNQADENGLMTGFGPRFFDGYYQTLYNGYSKFYRTADNQFATPLLTFLSDASTNAFIGLENTDCSMETGKSYYDDITYYDTALTEAQVKKLYGGESYLLGDVNNSGKVELSDANLTLKAALGIIKMEGAQMEAADVVKNNKIDLSDANLILKAALGIVKLS